MQTGKKAGLVRKKPVSFFFFFYIYMVYTTPSKFFKCFSCFRLASMQPLEMGRAVARNKTPAGVNDNRNDTDYVTA